MRLFVVVAARAAEEEQSFLSVFSHSLTYWGWDRTRITTRLDSLGGGDPGATSHTLSPTTSIGSLFSAMRSASAASRVRCDAPALTAIDIPNPPQCTGIASGAFQPASFRTNGKIKATPIASSLNGGISYCEQYLVSTCWPLNRRIRASSFSRRTPYNNSVLGPISKRIWSTILSIRVPAHISNVTPATTMIAAPPVIQGLHRAWLSSQNEYLEGGLHGDQSGRSSGQTSGNISITRNIISIQLPRSRKHLAALSVLSRDSGFIDCLWTAEDYDDYANSRLIINYVGFVILCLVVVAILILAYFSSRDK